MTWTVELAFTAVSDLDRLPLRVAPAVIEFIFGPLAKNPLRLGKQLHGELEGRYGARRGEYRIIYTILNDSHTVAVARIDHRAQAHRPR